MYDADYAIFILLVVAIIVVLLLFLAQEFYSVAKEKGFFALKYFFIALFLPVIGYLLVIALPDRNNSGVSPQNREKAFGAPVRGFASGAMDIPSQKQSVDKGGTHNDFEF